MNKEVIWDQIHTTAVDAWLGIENRKLLQEERLDTGYRVIDTVISSLARYPAFLELEASRDLFALGHQSIITFSLGVDCIYELEFIPKWEGQILKLKKGNRRLSVDTTLIQNNAPDALLDYTEEGKEPNVNDTNSVKNTIELVKELITDLSEWSPLY